MGVAYIQFGGGVCIEFCNINCESIVKFHFITVIFTFPKYLSSKIMIALNIRPIDKKVRRLFKGGINISLLLLLSLYEGSVYIFK